VIVEPERLHIPAMERRAVAGADITSGSRQGTSAALDARKHVVDNGDHGFQVAEVDLVA
jgi:hypothetical protein